jgi:uncharacterized protein YdhG (YjbR/CyaY superfamily)
MHPDKPSKVEEYLAAFPEEIKKLLQKLRKCIQTAAPEAQEKISYGMPTFYLKGNLVHFAGYQRHIGFYPTPSAVQEFQNELASYKTSKGAVQFPLDQDLPLELITRMVKFRVQENLNRTAS